MPITTPTAAIDIATIRQVTAIATAATAVTEVAAARPSSTTTTPARRAAAWSRKGAAAGSAGSSSSAGAGSAAAAAAGATRSAGARTPCVGSPTRSATTPFVWAAGRTRTWGKRGRSRGVCECLSRDLSSLGFRFFFFFCWGKEADTSHGTASCSGRRSAS